MSGCLTCKARSCFLEHLTRQPRVCPRSPPLPLACLPQVIPYLKNEGLRWTLEGRSIARQALLTSGLLPVLAAPTPSGEHSLPL